MKLLKFFELYELQWSRLLHLTSGREDTGGLEKKKKKEKVAGARMGYCPFSKIESQYSRLYCGTQQVEQAHSRLSRHAGLGAPGGGRDTAEHGHDTTGCARDTVEEAYDTTRSNARGRATTWRMTQGETWHVTRPVQAATRPSGRPRYGRGRPATRQPVRHDTVGLARSVRTTWAMGVCTLCT